MRKLLIGLVPVVLVVAVGGVALGTIPSANGVIHACFVKQTGALRVVSSNRHCPSGQAPLNWNVRGPRGPRGPQGPQGPGARLLRFSSDGTSGYQTLLTLNGYVFKASCTVNVNNTGETEVKLHYVIPDGVTTSEAGSSIDPGSYSYPFQVSGYTGEINLEEITSLNQTSGMLIYTIAGSNGKSMDLSVTASVNPTATAPSKHCDVLGTVTPVS